MARQVKTNKLFDMYVVEEVRGVVERLWVMGIKFDKLMYYLVFYKLMYNLVFYDN